MTLWQAAPGESVAEGKFGSFDASMRVPSAITLNVAHLACRAPAPGIGASVLTQGAAIRAVMSDDDDIVMAPPLVDGHRRGTAARIRNTRTISQNQPTNARGPQPEPR